jgi:multidrug efflux pump subunit AcrA (membrane-fusion protein)
MRSGQYARVSWPAGSTESLWIPESALEKVGQIERVFVVENEHLHLRIIKSGKNEDGWIQVLAGLNGGEQVVLSVSSDLRDGQPVL